MPIFGSAGELPVSGAFCETGTSSLSAWFSTPASWYISFICSVNLVNSAIHGDQLVSYFLAEKLFKQTLIPGVYLQLHIMANISNVLQ